LCFSYHTLIWRYINFLSFPIYVHAVLFITVTPRRKVFHEKLTVTQIVNTFPTRAPHWPLSPVNAVCFFAPWFFKIHTLTRHQYVHRFSSLQDFSQFFYTFLISHMHASCSTHLIFLDLIILIMFGDGNSCHVILSNTLSLPLIHVLPLWWNTKFHAHTTQKEKLYFLHILIFMVLDRWEDRRFRTEW
jgi:hypothetical protein